MESRVTRCESLRSLCCSDYPSLFGVMRVNNCISFLRRVTSIKVVPIIWPSAASIHDMSCSKGLLFRIDALPSALEECLDQNRARVELPLKYIPHVECYEGEWLDVISLWFGLRKFCSLVISWIVNFDAYWGPEELCRNWTFPRCRSGKFVLIHYSYVHILCQSKPALQDVIWRYGH